MPREQGNTSQRTNRFNVTGKLHPSGEPLELLDVHYRRQKPGSPRQGALDAFAYGANGEIYMLLDSPLFIAKGGSWAPAKYPDAVLARERVEVR